MKKRWIVFGLLSVLLLSVFSFGAAASENTIDMQIGNPEASAFGQAVTLDAPPVISNDQTMVPLRFLSETLGYSVFWDAETRTVFVFSGEQVVTLQIGLEFALAGDGKLPLDAPPVIMNDRTMVPLRFIAETFGMTADWNEETQTVSLSKAE